MLLTPRMRVTWSGAPPCTATVPALGGGQWCLSVREGCPDHGVPRWIWIVAHSEDARIGRHGSAHGPDLARQAAEEAAAGFAHPAAVTRERGHGNG